MTSSARRTACYDWFKTFSPYPPPARGQQATCLTGLFTQEIPMPTPELSDNHEVWLSRLTDHLKEERYSRNGLNYRSPAKRFPDYLQRDGLTVQTVQPSDVEKYLNKLRRQRKSDRRAELSRSQRLTHRSAIRMLLRLVHGQWPLAAIPSSERELFHRQIVKEYDRWMSDLRGLCLKTRNIRCADTLRFLEWLGDRGSLETLSTMKVADIDAYVQWRASSLQRSSIKMLTVHLRSVLRYLHDAGRIPDLASAVIGPKLYALEGIPSALRADEVDKVLQSVRQDRSPIGLRDYAILSLLSTYGLRAGEITALRLEDIDWTHDRIRIRHSKTGMHSELPLLRAPGEAILDYLRKGRPKTIRREVFLRAYAPYRAFRSGSGLYTSLGLRLKAAGVTPQGKKGPHAFRHARAASLLRSAVPLKVIGDVLAHRSTQSTMIYLKLDLEELRGIALEIPRALP
jgi:integrase/recombinase XerD